VLYNIEPELLRNGDPTYLHKKLTETVASLPTTLIFLHPKRLVFFPYPKTADNGTGFGCLMPFWLMKLQVRRAERCEAGCVARPAAVLTRACFPSSRRSCRRPLFCERPARNAQSF